MSDDRDDEPTLGSVLDAHRDAWAEELHTAVPGRVESYTAGEQVADVQPMIRRRIERRDGSAVYETMPIIRAVPIVWPRAGDWFVHMPLAAGDFVLLVMCERDIARWRQTGELSPPLDVRHHHLSHAVAIPGVYPRTRELGDVPTDALVIGKDGGSTIRIKDGGEILVGTGAAQFAALANLVKARLDTIQAAFDAHIHSGGTISGNTGVPAAVIGPLADVAASKVKVE